MNGPNLNLLGLRESELYGRETLGEIIRRMRRVAKMNNFAIEANQSNHEGTLVTWIQEIGLNTMRDKTKLMRGIVLNAGGLTHTSVPLRDAVDFARSKGVPTVEVHLSDIHARETFRHVSLLREVCIDQVSGLGARSYTVGLTKLIAYLEKKNHRSKLD